MTTLLIALAALAILMMMRPQLSRARVAVRARILRRRKR